MAVPVARVERGRAAWVGCSAWCVSVWGSPNFRIGDSCCKLKIRRFFITSGNPRCQPISADAFARGVQLRHLRCLVAVAQERHLARAAERLALSQPAVSKTLAELEALAGTRLVERGSAGRRGVQGLTPAGEQLLVHALRVLEAVDASALAIAPATGAQVAAPAHRRVAERGAGPAAAALGRLPRRSGRTCG